MLEGVLDAIGCGARPNKTPAHDLPHHDDASGVARQGRAHHHKHGPDSGSSSDSDPEPNLAPSLLPSLAPGYDVHALSPARAGAGSVVGLRNLGNTCYANSVLQCLARFSVVAERARRPPASSAAVASDFAEVMAALTGGQGGATSAAGLHRAIGRATGHFSDFKQEDAHEFLLVLLDLLHKDHASVPAGVVPVSARLWRTIPEDARSALRQHAASNTSFVTELFCGLMRSSVSCRVCGVTSNSFEPFLDITVSIPKDVTSSLEALLAHHTSPEEMTDLFQCDRCCRKQPAVKRLQAFLLPPVLVIHLKRFTSHCEKVSQAVTFPLVGLGLGSLLHPDSPDAPRGREHVYDLVGISTHHGSSVRQGHYTATGLCSSRLSPPQWFQINDEEAKAVPATFNQGNPGAYLLFYQRRWLV